MTTKTLATEEPGITERERASRILSEVQLHGTISGMQGPGFITRPITVRRLADHGVPELLCLPFDTDSLRALVQELAQLAVD
jgi:hypothetical protein